MKTKKISIDFKHVNTLDEMHEALMKVFHFPDFYGKNVNKKFIETSTNQTSEYKSSEIDQAFIELEKKKVLVRRNPDFMVFNIIDL